MQRTFDYRHIKRIANRKNWYPTISSEFIYLVEDESLWIFHPFKDGLMIHVIMNIHCRGKPAIHKGKSALEWIFDNTNINVIYASIKKENKPACHNARRSGMEFTHEKDNMRFYEVRRCLN